MFNINIYEKNLRNKYTSSIDLKQSKNIQNIVNKNKTLYRINFLCKLITRSIPVLYVPLICSADDENIIVNFETMLDNNIKKFCYVECLQTSSLDFDSIIIFAEDQEGQIYNKLLRFEKLKAFL